MLCYTGHDFRLTLLCKTTAIVYRGSQRNL